METLIYVLVGVILFICVLLIAIIMLQEDKSGGGIGIVGGSSQSFFGASSSSILVRITSVLLTLFIIMAVVVALISSSFTGQSMISEKDIALTEREQYEMELKKTQLTVAPLQINVDDFESQILEKLSGTDKDFISEIYTMDKNGKIYQLQKKISDEDSKKLIKILNSIQYTQQAQTTIIKSE